MKMIDKFGEKINGILSTFDRMILKGHLRQFFSPSGKTHFLSQENVLLKDLGEYAKKVTGQIKDYVENLAQVRQRPLIDLNSPKISKEESALDVLKRDPSITIFTISIGNSGLCMYGYKLGFPLRFKYILMDVNIYQNNWIRKVSECI